MASWHSNNIIVIWNINSGVSSQLTSVQGSIGPTQLNNLLIFGSSLGIIEIYNMSLMSHITSFNCSSYPTSLVAMPNSLLVIGLSNGGISIYDLNQNYSLITTIIFLNNSIIRTEFLYADLVATSTNNSIVLWGNLSILAFKDLI